MIERDAYRLELATDGRTATLLSKAREHRLTISLLAAFDTTDGRDETLALAPPAVDGDVIEVERRSTRWERAGVRVVCGVRDVTVEAWVGGGGDLTDVHLLGGRLVSAGAATGFFPSGSSFRTLFTPNPGDPGKLVRSAAEGAVIGVSGDGAPGRGHWFFTPAPLWLGLTADEREWLGLGVVAPVGELDFVQLEYRAADRAFHLVLDYEGHTRVRGEFRAPTVVVTPGLPDPSAGLRSHREDLDGRGFVPRPRGGERPGWWSEPIFCGWGAQCHLARTRGALASSFATQEHYDGFLGTLEQRGVVPGTVVIDDKWQAAYGTNEPDTGKWPDLRAWIAGRHERGQRVLLWWKAWDPEGLPADLCVRVRDDGEAVSTGATGAPVAVDPSNPAARERLREVVASLLAPGGLDADGLKIDFTARTPSGVALVHHGPAWGIALLHELLAVVYAEAKRVKPDALLITQTPNPAFVDVADMIRLNDMLRLDDPGPPPPVVPQMRYRAEVVHAACPELLVDTDDWCVPDRRSWRRYLEVKPELGVPSLYYATHLDWSGEPLEDEDYAELRRVWERWRARLLVR